MCTLTRKPNKWKRDVKNIAVWIVVLGCAVAVPSTQVAAAPAAQQTEQNAFEEFREQELQRFRETVLALSRDKTSDTVRTAKLKDYARRMVERYEKFRDSPEGTPYMSEANKDIVEIAIALLDDREKVRQAIALEKDPERACRLKLFAAELFGHRGQTDPAKTLVEEVLTATKDKFPSLHKEAEVVRFRVAPAGLPFPELPKGTRDLDGEPIRIADYEGKVVLVDFWASWCGPCLLEAPNVVRAYKKYHPKGFEIIGISLDESRDRMLDAMKEHGMTWRQYFDGLGWNNKVSTEYGIMAIPATYLVGPDGKIVTNQVRGELLEARLEELLGAKR